jgi:uncharacterized repeat protein (TIGR02543 family)
MFKADSTISIRLSRWIVVILALGFLTIAPLSHEKLLPVANANQTFSQTFTSGQTPSASITTAWDNFAAALTGTYTTLTISGTNGSITVTHASFVNQIATSIRTFNNSSTNQSWLIGSTSVATGNCSVSRGIELTIGASGVCSCSASGVYTIRAKIGNSNWGGINGPTCSAATQTITVTFGGGTNTVTFSANGGSGSASISTVTQSSVGASVTLAAVGTLSRSGYTFSGWNTLEDGSGTTINAGASYTPASSLTLYAQWNSFITYNANGATSGTIPDSTTAKSSSAVTTLRTNTGTLARTNYVFGGWNTNETGTGTSLAAGLTTYSSTGNRTLFAQWNSVISYNANGATSGSVPGNSTVFGSAGTLAGNTGSLARTNFALGGWNTNESGTGTSYALSSSTYPPSGARTLFAQWNSTITYNANGNTSGSIPAASSIPPTGGALALNSGNLAKTGATFVGWSTASNGIGTFYLPGATYLQRGNATLFAIYSTALAMSGPTTLGTSVGSAGTSTAIAATGGVGNKSFTHVVSPANSGITIDTATTNSVFTKVSSTVPSGTYTQIITATDGRGETLTRTVTISVAAPLRFAVGNLTTVTTSVGRSTTTVINTTGGNTNRTFTKMAISGSSSGITLDTTTASSGFATLNVSSAVPAGTYVESITANDLSGVAISYQITIVVNPAPVLAYESLTAGSNFTSMNFNGTGAHVTLPANANWQLGSNYTIEWWQYQTGTNAWPRIFSFGSSGLAVSIENNTFYFWNSGARVMNSSTLVNFKDRWVHFAIVSRNNSVIVYQNGIALRAAQTLPTVTATQIPTSSQLCIAIKCGTANTGEMFGGQITNFVIAKSARYTGTSTTTANFTPSGFVSVDANTLVALTAVNSEAKFTDSSSYARLTTNVNSPTGSSSYPASSGGTVSIVTTEGLTTRSSAFIASSGTGTKTFTIAPTFSGITLDTSETNKAYVVLAPTLAATNSTTAATYRETVTATDSLNASNQFNVTITVNPRIALTAVTQTLTTSSGVAAFDTITATTGTGTGALTFSLVSNPFSSGITLASNGARSTVLTVARTVPQGTYYETITATDSLGSTTSIAVTVVVNPGISLVGEGNVSTITTSVGRTASLQVNAINGASGKTFTMAPTIAGITLNTTNAASGYAVVQVANTVLANTYLETVTVTDSAGGTARLMVTIIVNAAPTLTGPTTVAMTAGRAASTTVYTTASGSGTKSFSLSGLNAGVTIETSTLTTAFVRLASTLTSTSTTVARTITETVTATDASGATARITLTITVNPAVIETATALSVTTTSGVAASTTVFASQGTGNKTFTRASATASAGITMNTSVLNRATISIASNVSAGTYFETITATDTLGAETSTVLTITVNGPPTVSGATNLVTTFGVAFTSPVFSAASGDGTYTFSLVSNPTNAGITISSLINGQARISVGSSVATGTYNETLTVTDGLGATGRMNFTIKVNAPVALTGTQTVNATYGEAFTTGFNSSGGTGPFVFSATNICAVSRSTYSDAGTSYTVDQIRGDGTCNWVVPTGVTAASVLTVAGGGGGGGSSWAGGGGAGGVVSVPTVALTAGQVVSIVVGTGGNGGTSDTTCSSGSSPSQGSNGNDSSFNATFVAKGGGGGGGYGWGGRTGCGSGKSGGSGGGSGETDYLPAIATSTQQTFVGATSYGNSGGRTTFTGGIQAGSGGGGAAGTGVSTNPTTRDRIAGKGGDGVSSSITGAAVTYGGGGGGATCNPCGGTPEGVIGIGGSGGGGAGGNNATNPVPGTNALGGGGGGSQTGTGAKGGSGVVIVRYVTPTVDADNSKISYLVSSAGSSGAAGLLTLSIPESVTAGSYSHTVKVTDSNGAVSTPVTINITVAKANPVLTLALPAGATSTSYGFGVTLSAQASTGGTVNFRDNGTTITGCGSKSTTAFVATCRWVPNTVATRTISAVFTPTDTANYNSGVTTTMSVVVTQADTLTVTARSENFVFTDTTTAVTRGFTLTGLAEIDSATAVTMTYIGAPNDTTAASWSSTTAPRLAGDNYEIRPSALSFTSGASSNYRAITYVSGNLVIARAAQVADFNYGNNNQLTYSLDGTETATVTKLGETAPLFTHITPDKCSLNSSTGLLSILEAGTCSVTMEIPEGFNYLTTTVSKNVTIAKAARTITLTSSALTIKYGDTATITTTVTAGAVDGLITYTASSPTSCSFDEPSGEITVTSASGTCGLTARIAEGINYLGDTSTALSITTTKADGPEVRVGETIPVAYNGSTAVVTPTFTVSGLKLTDVASTSLTFTFANVGDTGYSSTTPPTLGGTYRINPSDLSLTSGSLANYNSPVYVFAEFVIEPIDQPELFLTNLTGDLAFPVTLKITGGHVSTPAVTYTAINGTAANCRIAYGVLSNSGGLSVWYLQADSAGSCSVIATKPADRNYRIAISDTSTVTVLEFRIGVTPVVENAATGVTIAPSTPLTKGPNICNTGCVPSITSINVLSAIPGDLVLITGLSFNQVNKVYFRLDTFGPTDDVEAPNFVIDSDTQISVLVPAGLTPEFYTIRVATPDTTSARFYDIEILP